MQRKKELQNNEPPKQLSVIKVPLPCVLHFAVKMEICINHSVCVCVCVAGWWRVWMGQSSAFLLGGDVMRTSSPLADRQPCLCSSLEQQPHCARVCVSVRESETRTARVCVCARACIAVRLRYWLRGGGGEAERHLRGCTFPPPLREKGTTY